MKERGWFNQSWIMKSCDFNLNGKSLMIIEPQISFTKGKQELVMYIPFLFEDYKVIVIK